MNNLPSRVRLPFAIVLLFVVIGGALIWQFNDLIGSRLFAPTPFPTLIGNADVSTGIVITPPPTPEIVQTLVSTAIPSSESSPTPGPSPTPSRTPTPTLSPTATSSPTKTPTPTVTPTSLPQIEPTLMVTGVGTLIEGFPTPATAIPSPVPTFEIPLETTNVLLIGSDNPLENGSSRSDTMIIVSINHEGPTASMVSLPRDLYVYIPGKTMNRLNTAINLGGVDLLKQTILYNFGIPIHYYAQIDFQGFKDVVDAIGGIDINVSCRLQDWRLKSPDLEPEIEDNWEQFALEPGVHHMDGDLALWYARSRLSTNDFDRGRRQQHLLRAMLNQGIDLGLIAQVPTLWNVFKDYVATDIDIGRLLQFATLAPAIRDNNIQHLYLAGKTESWTVPTSGAFVQIPIWEGDRMMEETLRHLFLPPALSKSTNPLITVEVINVSNNPDLALLAADNLAWYGFAPVVTPVETYPGLEQTPTTTIKYFAPNFKGSYDWLISWIFNVRRSDIQLVTDDLAHPTNYQVVVANDYNPCINPFYGPQIFAGQ